MKRGNGGQIGMKELRRRAERRLGRTLSNAQLPGDMDAMRQVHELHVHQVELEMQNLELQRIRAEMEEGLARYTALYDFAPIGYFTLDRSGRVAKLNLTGAKLLGQARSALIGRRLAEFVLVESRSLFAAFLERVFSGRSPETVEVELAVRDRRPLFAHVEAISDESAAVCRAMVVDITARRLAEQRADELLRQNRSLTRRMFGVQEAERRELARELHDELGQWLTAIQAEAEAICSGAGIGRDPRLLVSARAIRDSAQDVLGLIRQMLLRLRPGLLDSLGLAESLQELAAQWRERHPEIRCVLELTGEFSDLPEPLGITVYRIVQEALTNVAKHSRGSGVAVRLQRDARGSETPDSLLLTVEDDGVGLDPAHLPSGLGLLGMRERVIAADGDFSLHSKPPHGVRIIVRLPVSTPLQAHK